MPTLRNTPKRPVGTDAFHIWCQWIDDRVKKLRFFDSNTVRVKESQVGFSFEALGGGGGSSSSSTTSTTRRLGVIQVNTDGNTLLVGGQVVGVTITAAGTGYTVGSMTFNGGGGSGAAGTALLSGGTIIGVTVTNGGNGYTSAPGVVFTGGGTGATGTAVLNNNIVALPPDLQKVTYDGKTVALVNGTHVYAFVGPGLRTDQVTLPDGTTPLLPSVIWPPYLATSGVTPTGWNAIYVDTPDGGTGVTTGIVTAVTINTGGSGYGSPPSVTFSAPPVGGITATGTAVIASGFGGAVIAVTITDPGSGYATPPTITFGSGAATATAIISTPTLMDTNRSARRWETSIQSCYNGSAGYQLVPSAPTTTNP
jgi:hypothetical protein